ncbi:hypothetical protein FNV43_RR07481 [Rhamnella rubrinervis]|uniref:RING-type E3 ubiquitin transferase n=1 Tax=Rhamnella rubrinervis TaxID=2594499 RepID=A0A8K0MM86_9ROSA|nr:hypothetical protein FNV43_RR07481 [Rhamnella rubrinervis]
MGSEEDEDGFDKLGSTRKVALTVSSLFVSVLLIITVLLCYRKHLQRHQETRRRRRLAYLYQLSSQGNIGGAVPLELINFEQPQPKSGLDPLVIASLPEFVYKPKAKKGDHDHKDEGDEQVIDCSVCLSTIDEETTVRLLPNCKHMFHVECIDMWLGSNTTCPICRDVVEPRVQDQQAVGGSGVAVQATAPPMALDDEGTVQQGDEVEKASGSGGSRLSSFRRMFSSRDRSSRRVGTCGEEDAAADDIERQ